MFGTAPTAVVCAPGRVNLIGEHLDYAGLPVLPMAIERRITLHVGPRADWRVRVVNACRLTGAGFGGCVLALVSPAALDGFLERLHAAFYEPRGLPPHGSHLFAVRPASGATVSRV